MIKVCYIIDAPYAGGAERYIALLAGALDKYRFAPSVLIKRQAGMVEWRMEMERRGIPATVIDMNLPFRPQDAFALFGELRHLGPDIVHVNSPGPYDGQMGLAAPVARFAGASRVVVTEHLPMVERSAKRAIIKEFAYRWVDKVLTVCHANVPYLIDRQKVPAAKIEVIHNALQEDFGQRSDVDSNSMRERYGLPPECVAIAFVGSLIERKGFPVLLDALQPLDNVHWRLLVAGDGAERGRYERLTKDMGMEDRVQFLGMLAEQEVEAMMRSVDLLALPSFMEAMPYVILEAMACGLPVIASNIYGIDEMVVDSETAVLIPPGDAARLSGGLRELIGDTNLRRHLGGNARNRFEQLFTLDRQIDKIQSIYLELLGMDTRKRGSD
jgi:glycosyltransferase involved in cell wall biosynthesis